MPPPAAPLIRVDGETLPVLNFAEIILDVPHQVPIGYVYEGTEYVRRDAIQWSEHFGSESAALRGVCLAILAEAGYRVSNADTHALRLVGTMGRVSYNSYAVKIPFDQAECQMTWQLFRPGEDAPMFTAATDGAGRTEGNQMGTFRAAFELALRRLLANPEFVAAVHQAD